MGIPATFPRAFLVALVALLLMLAGTPALAVASTRLVVRERTPASQTAERLVQRLGGHVGRPLPLLGGFAASVPADAVATLRRARAIRAVYRDAAVQPQGLPDGCDPEEPACYITLPPETTWQSAVRLTQAPMRYRGRGIGVALIDTGVTPSADLGSRLLARIDLTSEGDGLDRYGHGTHMAGLIAGNGALGGGSYPGAAPEANLVSVKVAGWDGATDVSTIIAGLQWAVSNRDRYGLRVVNLSYGTDSIQPADRDPLNFAVEQTWRAGLAVVVSAGNDAGAVTKPGDDPYVITVGAADVNGTASVADDAVAAFSNHGAGKPDLVAPGVSIVSLRAAGSSIDVFAEEARVGAAYLKGTGTSQAAAIVTGVVARMVDANACLTPDQIKGSLVASANAGLDGAGGGAGLLDAAGAIAKGDPSSKGKGSGAPIPRANRGLTLATGLGSIEASRGSDTVVTDLDGDGVPEPLSGEMDAFGRPWDPLAFAAAPWTLGMFAATPWAEHTAELTALATVPAAVPAPRIAWEARHWVAGSWLDAGWDADAWAARHWGARHWGGFLWR
ncbi:MAG: serine protease AprX [Gaiellaceae bacterium]|nr:serine protease AprX [Gaiellaceae bacterium]